MVCMLGRSPGEIADTPALQSASGASEQTAQIQLGGSYLPGKPALYHQPCPLEACPLQT